MTPERIHYARSADGVEIAWTVSGDGPRTVLLAANHITDIQRDWEHPLRSAGLARLSRSFRVIRYDHRGCGASQRNVARQGLEAWVEDLEAVAEAAGLDGPAILLAYSQAGPYAAAFAAKNPGRLSHLAVHGSYACGAQRRGDPELAARSAAMLELVRVGWGASFPGPRMLVTAHLVTDPTAEESAWNDRHMPLMANAEDALRFFTADAWIDARPVLGQVRTPTLVMATAEDSCILPQWSRRLAAAIPGAQYLELPGRNHILLARDPSFELFFEHLEAFVAEAEPPEQLAGLSPREREILDGVCAGLSNEAIALQRNISPKTVRNHLTRIFDKLRVNSRTQAALTVTAPAWRSRS